MNGKEGRDNSVHTLSAGDTAHALGYRDTAMVIWRHLAQDTPTPSQGCIRLPLCHHVKQEDRKTTLSTGCGKGRGESEKEPPRQM